MNELVILDAAIKAASPWVELQVRSSVPTSGTWNDAVVALKLKTGISTKYKVEVKQSLTPSVIKYLVDKAPVDEECLLLVAPYITPSLAQLCIDLGINYLDTAGNVYINHPQKLIYIAGQSRKGSIGDSQSTSKRAWVTGSGLRIIFNLLISPELVRQSYREIALSSNTALGSVGKVMGELEAAGHLIKGRRLVNKDELARVWAMYYSSVLRPKQNVAKYSLVGRINDESMPWQTLKLETGEAVWGGEEGAFRLDGYLKPASATLYTWTGRHTLMSKYRLKPDPQGAIEILDAFWPPQVVFGVEAPALLIYADLIGSPDSRNHEAAEKLWPRILNV